MEFGIRDDDTCFFTKPCELKRAYDFLNDIDDVISLSVVTNAVPMHRDKRPFGYHKYQEYYIEDNTELISYLRDGVNKKSIDILLHGYSHEYNFRKNNWEAEMMWKDRQRQYNEIANAKERLENLLECNISVFVPPCNKIGKIGIEVIESLDMDLSGIIFALDRRMDIKYISNFIKRWGTRIVNGIQYGGMLDYGKHVELNAYNIDDETRLIREYEYCKKRGFPFVIYTHYWSLLKNPDVKRKLEYIYKYAKADGAKLKSVTELINNCKGMVKDWNKAF